MSDAHEPNHPERPLNDDARRAAERAAGEALDGAEAADEATGTTRLDADARRVWTEHLFVHGLLTSFHEAETSDAARESRVEAVMSSIRAQPKLTAVPWLHYAAAAAVLAFLVIGGLLFFGRGDDAKPNALDAAFQALSEDVDLEYVGDIAFERSDGPLESHESTFITGPERFYVKTWFPTPFGSGRMPFEFGALGERRWIKMMGFPLDLNKVEERMERRGIPYPKMFGDSMDPLKLVTDLGALLKKIRETCDVDFGDGGVSKNGERLVLVRGTPRNPDAVAETAGLESIMVRVGERSNTVESFTLVFLPPAPPPESERPRSFRFRSRMRDKLREKDRAAVKRVTVNFRLVREFQAPRSTFLPAALDDGR